MLDIVSRAIETGRGSDADAFSYADGTLPRFVPWSNGRPDTLDFRAVRSLDEDERRATIPNGLMVYAPVTRALPISKSAVSRVVTAEGEMVQRLPQTVPFCAIFTTGSGRLFTGSPVRARVREKWRSTANSRGPRRLDAAGLHNRKVWQTGGLRSGTNGSGHGEMALWTLEKPPFGAIFEHFLDDFLRVFPRACLSGRELAGIRPRKALVLNHSESQTARSAGTNMSQFEPR